ncbi:MAG: EAL domain-containing protein [Legionellaceae bacterium]|nr:EAL domain-containing protein [Legionellaceae bacterium]
MVTRIISKEEAEQCANEKVQFIGTVQPHGFCIVVDPKTEKIVQYSENFLQLLNSKLSTKIPLDTVILDTYLYEWMKYDKKTLFENLIPKFTQSYIYPDGGRISARDWECLGVIADNYFLFEFFPASESNSSYNLLSNLDRMVAKIRFSKSLTELFQTMTSEFQKHTGYDRVMLYKFLPDWSGEVLSESVSSTTEIKYLGMRFPSEDIPKSARELYATSSLRVMADVDATPSKLTPELLPSGIPLDQSQSILRGMSLMHIQYLKNLGVKSSMSIGLMSNGKLWGLMAFHHYAPNIPPNHMVSEMKASCELFSEIILSYLNPAIDLEAIKEKMHKQKEIEQELRFVDLLCNEMENLKLSLINVRDEINQDFMGICMDNRCFIVTPRNECREEPQLFDIVNGFLASSGSDFFQSSKLLDPKSDYNKEFKIFKELNLAGLSILRGVKLPDLIVFFGKLEVKKTISWGGEPHTVNIKIIDGKRKLEPRSSFVLWQQNVEGHSEDWTTSENELLNIFMTNIEDGLIFSKSEELKLKLKESSYTDSLTGLPNRRYLEEHIKNLSMLKEKNSAITVFFLDLDNFKNINDFIGHEAGDFLLNETAKRLRKCVRPDDIVVRLGGDEFVLVVQHLGKDQLVHKVTSKKIAEKIITVLSKPVFQSERLISTTSSIGVLICNPQKISYTDILKCSDIAMYYAKNMGKNQFHFFSKKDQVDVNLEVNMVNELKDAVSNNLIKVFYQTQVNTKNQVTGIEALARWHSSVFGEVSPMKFIVLAEENNLIIELGEHLFEKSCADLALWKSKNLLKNFETLSINVSAVQLADKKFSEKIKSIVKKYNLSNEDIRIELTESVLMKNFEETVDILKKLRKDGFTISLDDFGTGFSSLNYLLKLPIDEVKIDQSFVKSMIENDDAMVMIESIIKLCIKMGFEVVAEGVEDKRQLSLLTSFGCNTFQGYYFSKPVSPSEVNFGE